MKRLKVRIASACNIRYLAYGLLPALLLISACAISSINGEAAESENTIPAFLEIAPGLYRGGQPDEEGFKYLKSIGVKTILNFRNEKKWMEWEKPIVEQTGMEYISIPWQIYLKPDAKIMNGFFKVIDDKSNRPLFIHCQHGVDRTGVLTALYYIKYEKSAPEEAFRKAGETYPPRRLWLFFAKRQFRFFTEQLQKS